MTMDPSIRDFAQHAGAGLSQLLLMADLARKRNFAHDLDEGTIEFEPDIRLGVEVLGIANDESGDWVWAWDTTTCDFADKVLVRARALKALGESTGEPLFTQPRIDISGAVGGDEIALLAAARCGGKGWFVFPLQGKWRVYVVVTDDGGHLPPPGERPALFVVRVIRRMVEAYGFLDHRVPVRAYLEHERYTVAQDGPARLVADSPRAGRLVASFDDRHRLSSVETEEASG
ncbi:DUF6882 domain-containing protein [Arenibaculum sp.]|jgi:hypothetical protein|uniref:DUF6882 domain-containing protein n=1 Tax=Arenibaculum sp. TaxID=2865862 RepID=UPI002E132882|nr:DUF6882 domain-containing protein [Arenibaculum sp.]HEV7368446.1 hypothetical protein [Arenibaculum sp.]